MRIAVIDLGFNSIKLVNYEIKSRSSFKAYEQEGEIVRLGDGLTETGFLGKPAINRTVDALKLFRDIIYFQQIKHVLPFATSAVREAINKNEFIKHVSEETGFRFRILSEKEEALYSYAGAIKATRIPTALFFDLGGGSLELIYSENYRIKKVFSLPLGALRLSQMFSRKNNAFKRKDYEKMEDFIRETLPDKKELSMESRTVLVGVGGSLRALTRYDQEIKKYPLDKVHNYKIDFESVDSLASDLSDLNPEEISKIEAVGKNRAETITAGSCVVKMLMEKFGFSRITVSAHGLREGVLSTFLENPRLYYNGQIDQATIQRSVRSACELLDNQESSFSNDLVEYFHKKDLIKDREYRIFLHAYRLLSELPQTSNLHNLFFMILDEDSSQFEHDEQLILALSVIQLRKSKTADWLFKRYKSILNSADKESVARISACIMLCSILDHGKTRIKIMSLNGKKIGLQLIPSRSNFPSSLLANAVKKFEREFDISLDVSISLPFYQKQANKDTHGSGRVK